MSLTVMVPVSVTLDEEWWDTLLDMAGYGIGYWAGSAVIGDGDYTITYEDDGPRAVTLTTASIGRAIGRILSGDVRVNDSIRGYLRSAVLERDAGDIDADVADVVVQVAAFGEIVYA